MSDSIVTEISFYPTHQFLLLFTGEKPVRDHILIGASTLTGSSGCL